MIGKDFFSYMNSVRSKLPYDFINKYNDMLKQTPCYFKTDDYFLDDEEWTSYMNEATKYGYLVIISLKKLDLSSNYIM